MQRSLKRASDTFDSYGDDASGNGVEMSGNRADYKGKRAKRLESSHFRAASRRMRLTPWGCQLNVGLNSKNLHHVKQMLHLDSLKQHVGILMGFA